MPVISIVIPFLNAEKYLERCLKSIITSLNTADVSGEIILVDNGSKDRSHDIIEKFRKEYSTDKTLALTLLECQKSGASAARNLGAEKARGEYLWFIDADDTIREDAVSLLLIEAKKTSADMVMMGAERLYEDGHRDYLSAVDPASKTCRSRFVRYGAGPWQFLFRRKWWIEHEFKFREGMIHEDMELMSSLILYTEKFSSVDEPLYFYYQTPNSVLHKRSWSEHAYDIFPALEGLYGRFKAAEAEKTYHDELEWFFIWNLLVDSAKDFAKFPEGRDGFKRSRKMLREYYPDWRKNRFLKKKTLKLRLRVLLNYYHW